MYLYNKLKYMRRSALKSGKNYDILHDCKFENERILGEVLRFTHSIEKGLSIENVRLGFGYKKIQEVYNLILVYKNNGGKMDEEPIWMLQDAIANYLRYHEEKNYTDETIEKIKIIYYELSSMTKDHTQVYGGCIEISPTVYEEDEQVIIEKLFNDRHSVREFAHTPIDEMKLKAAIELAFRCPSACNRQCYRVHIIPKEKFSLLKGWFQGVGGFADDLEKMIIITGKISYYYPSEEMQHTVSAVVYASYLTMTLQAYGIGCCFLQRNLFPNQEWEAVASRLNIPRDEQAVCALGIGNYKSKYHVPISHRLKYDVIVTEH